VIMQQRRVLHSRLRIMSPTTRPTTPPRARLGNLNTGMDSWGRDTITRSERLEGSSYLRGKCESVQWLIPMDLWTRLEKLGVKNHCFGIVGSQGV